VSEKRDCAGAIVSRAGCRGRNCAAPVEWVGASIATGIKLRQTLPAVRRRAGWSNCRSVADAGLVRSNRRDGRQNRCGAAVVAGKQRQLAAVGNLTT